VSAAPRVGRIAVLGLGLIGASLARALGAAGVTVTGFDASADVRARARGLGLCDTIAESAAEAVADADIAVLAVPVGAMGRAAAAIAPGLKAGAVVTDTGSVKGAVIRDVMPALPPGVHFVPGDPIAGTEHSGPEAGFATLFAGRWCLLTPPAGTDPAAIATVTALWEAVGARVETMDPRRHDLVLAVTSHLPHLIAYNIVGTAADLETVTEAEVIKFSAGGFRDFTRIAASDPTMWRDVFLNNREAVLEILQRLTEDVTMLQRAIRWGDGDQLFDLFTRTRAIRRSIIEQGQDDAKPDFGRSH